MKNRILLLTVALMMLAQTALAGPGVQGDPCQNPIGSKFSVKIAIGSATTTLIAGPFASTVNQTGSQIDLCGAVIDATSGTSPTVQFECGTQTTTPCDTNPVALTGAMLLVAGTPLLIPDASTSFSCPVGTQMCIVTGGTTPVVAGYASYALQ